MSMRLMFGMAVLAVAALGFYVGRATGDTAVASVELRHMHVGAPGDPRIAIESNGHIVIDGSTQD